MRTKLEILEKEIRKDLPRLLEPTVGCWFKNNLENGLEQLVFIEEAGIGKLYYQLSYNNNESYNVKKIDENFEIIGHDILLSDVLEWFQKFNKNNDVSFDLYGRFRIYNGSQYSQGTWDLSKPYLKDQSEKLIDFLYDLIEK